TGGNHDCFYIEDFAAIGFDPESRIAGAFNAFDHLLQVKHCPERLDLRHECITQTLPGDVREGGNVVDRLLRIELGALAADLVEDVDDVRLHIEQAQLKHCEQAAGAGADDEYVSADDVRFEDFTLS